MVLAVDTTAEFGSLALARGAVVLEEVSLHEPSGFSHVLYGHLSALLGRLRWQGSPRAGLADRQLHPLNACKWGRSQILGKFFSCRSRICYRLAQRN